MPGSSSSPAYKAEIRNGISQAWIAWHGSQWRRCGSASRGVSRVDTSPLTSGLVTTARSSVATWTRPSRVGMPAALSGLSAAITRLAASLSDSGEVATIASNSSARR